MQPDLKAADAFLTMMAEDETITWQTFDDSAAKRRELAQVTHGGLDECASALLAANKAGAGIFWQINHGNGRGRKAENITAVRVVVLDLDGPPLQPVLTALLAAGIEPHAVVETSPRKYHVYFQVTGCALEQFKPAQQALAAKFGGDKTVCDLPRVLRVPGFLHLKGEPFLTRVDSMAPLQPYPFDELVRKLGLQTPARPTKARVQSPMGTFAEGGRNAALASLAGRLRRDGLSSMAIDGALLATNAERCVPPLDDAEVRGIAHSISRYPAGAAAARYQPEPEPEPATVEADPPTWPEPLLPGTSRVPEIDPMVLGGWLGDMAATVAASTQTPPAMAVMIALAVVAAIVQRRFEVAPYGDEYREPLAIWTMTVLGPGNRKTAVFKAFTQVIVDIEKREGDRLRRDIARVMAERDVVLKRIETLKMQAGKEDDATARQRLQEQIAELKDGMPDEVFAPRIFTGDITAERLQQLLVEQCERIAVLSDEGGIFNIIMGAYNGGMGSYDIWLQGHAGSTARIDRAGRMAHIDRATLTMGLALQPDILQDTGKAKKTRGSGLMARFLYVVPRSTVGTRDVRARVAIDDEARHRYEGGIQSLYDGTERRVGAPRVLPFTADARECWLELCEDSERRQGEGGRYAHMADWTSKLPGAAARIAAVLALAEHGTALQAVPAAAVQRAVKLARLLVPHAEAAFALMGASDGEADAHAVLAFLQRHELQTIVRRELQKAMEGRFRQLERLLVAVKLLQDWHVLGPERRTSGTGRPSVFYEVNPRLFVDKPHSSH